MRVDYHKLASEILAEHRRGVSKNRMLLLAKAVDDKEIPFNEREKFSENFAIAYAQTANMSEKSFPSFKSSCKSVCKARKPRLISEIVSAAIIDGSWSIRDSYIPVFFRRVGSLTSDNEINAELHNFIQEKSNPSGKKPSSKSINYFENCKMLLSSDSAVDSKILNRAVDEIENALQSISRKRGQRLEDDVKLFLETLKCDK